MSAPRYERSFALRCERCHRVVWRSSVYPRYAISPNEALVEVIEVHQPIDGDHHIKLRCRCGREIPLNVPRLRARVEAADSRGENEMSV